jgi:hypothetical protein
MAEGPSENNEWCHLSIYRYGIDLKVAKLIVLMIRNLKKN